jgi:uncharacterized protein (DUF2141 family)
MSTILWLALAPLFSAESPTTTSVSVEVSELASDQGQVECVLWAGPRGFPTDTTQAVAKIRTQELAHQRATCTFDAVPPGQYAVSLIHDENGDGRMTKNFLGIPVERYGFSRNPRPMMRAPRFDEASFAIDRTPLVLQVAAH